MAQIFAGADRRQIDPEVLEGFKGLPDNFWVFAEFTLSRNIDWFVIHPDVNGTLALIVIELKRTGQALAGDINNVWKQWSPDGWRDLVLGGPYRNYYWQAVEAANKLKEWLWNNQRRYRLGQDLLPQEAFKIWPDLLILSPPGTNHQLPLQPPNNFGKFFYSLDECLRHIETWRSRQLSLAPLSPAEMLRLAEALGLEQIWPPAPVTAPTTEDGDLAARLAALEARVRALEGALGAGSPPPQAAALAPSAPVPDWRPTAVPGAGRALTAPSSWATSAPPAPPQKNGAAAPSVPMAIGWIEEALRLHSPGQPLRFADLGNLLKSEHDFDARLHLGISLSDLVGRAEAAGRVRVVQRDRVPYAMLPDGVTSAEGLASALAVAESPTVRQKLGKEGLLAAVRIIAAAEDTLDGRVAQSVSLLKQLRESLPLNGGPALSNSEASRLLRTEFVGMDYLRTIPVSDVDLESGNLYTTEGYRLNREHPAVRAILDGGAANLHPDVEVRGATVGVAEVLPA